MLQRALKIGWNSAQQLLSHFRGRAGLGPRPRRAAYHPAAPARPDAPGAPAQQLGGARLADGPANTRASAMPGSTGAAGRLPAPWPRCLPSTLTEAGELRPYEDDRNEVAWEMGIDCDYRRLPIRDGRARSARPDARHPEDRSGTGGGRPLGLCPLLGWRGPPAPWSAASWSSTACRRLRWSSCACSGLRMSDDKAPARPTPRTQAQRDYVLGWETCPNPGTEMAWF